MWRVNARSRPAAAPVAATLLALLTSCSGEADQDQAKQEMAALIPADTVAIVRIASLDTFADHAREIAAAGGEDPSSVDLDKALAQLGSLIGDTELIDRRRPLALAVSMPRATPPAPVLLVPCSDPARYSASLTAGAVPGATSGSYVAVPLGARYQQPATPSKLLDLLTPGLVSLHADVDKLVAAFGPVIGAALSAFETEMAQQLEQDASGFDGEAMAELYVDVARSVLASLAALDMQLDYRDGELLVAATLQALPGSDLDGWSSDEPVDATELARHLRADSSVAIIGGWDLDAFYARLGPLMEKLLAVYPPEMRAAIEPLFANYKDIYRLLGSVYAMDGDMFGENGMSMRMHLRPDDATRFATEYTAMLQAAPLAKMGITTSEPARSENDGAVVDTFEIRLDVESIVDLMQPDADSDARANAAEMLTMFAGKEGRMPVRVASKGDRAIIEIGTDATSAAPDFATTAAPRPSVQAALQRLSGCNPFFIESFDFARMMQAMADQRGLPIPAGDGSADMMLGFGIKGREWRVVLSIDLEGIVATFAQARPR